MEIPNSYDGPEYERNANNIFPGEGCPSANEQPATRRCAAADNVKLVLLVRRLREALLRRRLHDGLAEAHDRIDDLAEQHGCLQSDLSRI